MSGSKNHLLDVLESTVSSSTAPDEKVLPYSNAMYRLREIHGSRDYILLQRQKLRSMTQSPDEPNVKFVKRVAAVAKLCDYSSEQMMETVADVVQSHTLNIKVREAGRKVMRKGGSITELLDKVRSAEIERQSKEIYAKNHQQPAAEIAATSYATSHPFHGYGHGSNFQSEGGFQRPRGGFQSRTRGAYVNAAGEGYRKRVPCWRCSSNFHRPHNCHAIDKVCRNCEVKGRIARACRKTLRC
ncbi:uncharacterized protein LOC131691950 [Topomyia yanbarensis]|uniref:uncharacterized protein LOC131691950 n=1 Tax=Topomyia yanbarensis TaxID=2498891 RepID=UPI00273C2867|nr:uncharacterized protein LOC131691950 [Topomyia yanbarensis]